MTSISSSGNLIHDTLSQTGLNENLSKWMTAQSAHETAGWTSNIFKSNNNAFGMKYAGQASAKGEKNGYADYDSIELSCIDLSVWYSKHRKKLLSFPLTINNLTDYVHFIKLQGYFEADETEYLDGCDYFYKKLYPNG